MRKLLKRLLPAGMFILGGLGTVCAQAGAWQALELPATANTRYGHAFLVALPAGYDAKGGKQWPLVVFLHGAGERGQDLDKLKTQGLPAYIEAGHTLPAIVVAPQVPAAGLWHPLYVDAVIDAVSTRFHVDPQRVYLTGLSMGGMGLWASVAAFPSRFAAIAPVAGAFPNDMIAYTLGRDPSLPADWLPVLAALHGMPIWIAHGEADPVVPFAFAQRVAETLRQLDLHPKVNWMKGVGHDSWTATYSETPAFYDWMFAQRAPAPQPVQRPVPDATLAGAYQDARGRVVEVRVVGGYVEIRWQPDGGFEEFLPIDGQRFIGTLLLRFDTTPGQAVRLLAPGYGVFTRAATRQQQSR